MADCHLKMPPGAPGSRPSFGR